jgi:hypothetical protein
MTEQLSVCTGDVNLLGDDTQPTEWHELYQTEEGFSRNNEIYLYSASLKRNKLHVYLSLHQGGGEAYPRKMSKTTKIVSTFNEIPSSANVQGQDFVSPHSFKIFGSQRLAVEKSPR